MFTSQTVDRVESFSFFLSSEKLYNFTREPFPTKTVRTYVYIYLFSLYIL